MRHKYHRTRGPEELTRLFKHETANRLFCYSFRLLVWKPNYGKVNGSILRQIPIFNHRQDETIVENDGEGDDNRDLKQRRRRRQ